jgi:diguanylate cyclase (GGDEF)-like protein
MDPLTRLSNRRRFTEALEAEAARSRRYGRPLTVVLIDIDYFKHVNDQFGHLTGDAVLESVAACLRGASRETDVPARYGGDEFALLLPETARDRARHLAERLAEAVRALPPYAAGAPRVTLSMGIADLGPRESTTALLGRADLALYEAKAAGRDRAVIALPGQPGRAEFEPRARADT